MIVGGGDPTLGSKYFDSTSNKQFLNHWVTAIRALGIDSLSGRIIGDAGAFSRDIVPPTWSWQNMGNYFGAGPCGLSVFDDYYTVFFNTTGKAGDTAEIAGIQPGYIQLRFDNAVTGDSISYDNANIFGAPYSKRRYMRGQLPLNKQHFGVKGSLPDPALVAALALDSSLSMVNIICGEEATTIRRLQSKNNAVPEVSKKLFTTYSPALSEIVAQTNIHSINLFAEHCLIAAGIELGAAPETLVAIDSVISFWTKKGMDTQGMSLNDGSGLSQYNAVSPRQMVFLLKYMKRNSENFDVFYNSMAIAGETGTIKNMFKGSIAEGKLRAKSGTVSRAKAYAGYVTSKSGREIAFSMVVNNFSCTSREARAKLEQLMVALAGFNK
jgi:D-alanyl-D-alanine carboxypeptidase/D-alanyl-D-alanine-endopeptidase (penicillin-binding protein 4)